MFSEGKGAGRPKKIVSNENDKIVFASPTSFNSGVTGYEKKQTPAYQHFVYIVMVSASVAVGLKRNSEEIFFFVRNTVIMS